MEMLNLFGCRFKVGTHEATSPLDLLQGLGPCRIFIASNYMKEVVQETFGRTFYEHTDLFAGTVIRSLIDSVFCSHGRRDFSHE